MSSIDWQPIFNPRSLAIVGASNDPTKFGGRTFFCMKDREYDGKLYAVNPTADDIDGEKAYARVQDIPDEVDMAIVAVAAPYVVQAIADCAEKGVRAVQILTAGFRETDSPDGAMWEEQVAEIARNSGMRIVGPNCFGIYSPESALTVLPGPDFPKDGGPVGLLSQSGGFTSFLVRKALGMGIRFSRAVSYGNACDLKDADFISYFEDDDRTKVIGAYIEGVSDGKKFLEVVKRTSLKKPVIAWKGGLTALGSRMVASHTASLGGSRAIWEGFFKQSGMVSVVGIDEMIDVMVGFLCLPHFRSNRVAVVSGGGAIAVAASDALDRIGLTLPQLEPEVQDAIRACLPASGNSIRNPVDTGPPIFLLPTVKQILEAVASSNEIDAVIAQHEVSHYLPAFVEAMADVIPTVRDESGKDFIVTMPEPTTSSDSMDIEETRRKHREWYFAHGVPVFNTLEQAVSTLGKIIDYNKFVDARA